MRRRWRSLSVGLVLAGLGGFLLYQFILDQQTIEWSNYTKVRDGMTRAEVESVLGPPLSIDAKPGGGREVHWIGRKQGVVCVEFSPAGTMVRKHYTEEGAGLQPQFHSAGPRLEESNAEPSLHPTAAD